MKHEAARRTWIQVLGIVGLCLSWVPARAATWLPDPLPRIRFQSSPIPSLVGYWPMDSAPSGVTPDASGNGNAGTLTGAAAIDAALVAPVPTSGNLGSLQLPTPRDYVNVPGNLPSASALQRTGSFTLAAWINTTQAAGGANQQGIIEKWGNSGTGAQNGYFLRLTTANYLSFAIFPASGASVGVDTTDLAPVAANTWTHVAGVYDQTAQTMTLYINAGASANLQSSAPVPGADQSDLHIGDDYGSNNFVGNIDEVRIYNRALSAAEIGILKQGQPAPGGLGAAGGAGNVVVSWSAAAGAASYNVYESSSGTGPWTLIGNTAQLTYTDNGATSTSTTYNYEVTALSVMESAPSGPVSASPTTPPPPPPPSVPSGPKRSKTCSCGSILRPDSVALLAGWAGLGFLTLLLPRRSARVKRSG